MELLVIGGGQVIEGPGSAAEQHADRDGGHDLAEEFGSLPTLVGETPLQGRHNAPVQFCTHRGLGLWILVRPDGHLVDGSPARYLLLTHWDSLTGLEAWLASPGASRLRALGEVSAVHYLPIYHAPGERERLTSDGFQRGWGSEARVQR